MRNSGSWGNLLPRQSSTIRGERLPRTAWPFLVHVWCALVVRPTMYVVRCPADARNVHRVDRVAWGERVTLTLWASLDPAAAEDGKVRRVGLGPKQRGEHMPACLWSRPIAVAGIKFVYALVRRKLSVIACLPAYPARLLPLAPAPAHVTARSSRPPAQHHLRLPGPAPARPPTRSSTRCCDTSSCTARPRTPPHTTHPHPHLS